MRYAQPVFALLLLLGLASLAEANVPRIYFEGDPDYTSAKVQRIVGPSLLTAWVIGWGYWARQGSWRRKLIVAPLIMLPMCGCAVMELGSGGTYFISGTRPADVRTSFGGSVDFRNMRQVSPDPQVIGLALAAGVALSCGILGVVLPRRSKGNSGANAGGTEKPA